MAVSLSHRWGVDPWRPWIAALLHDLAKPYSTEKQGELLKSCRVVAPDEDDRDHPSVWHGFIAAQEGADSYRIDDPEILRAVAQHTTGAPHLADVGLVLFAADFLEPSRSFDGVETVRAQSLACATLPQAALIVARRKLDFLHKKGRTIHPRTAAMLAWLENGAPAAAASSAPAVPHPPQPSTPIGA